jgi:hypothetical protein
VPGGELSWPAQTGWRGGRDGGDSTTGISNSILRSAAECRCDRSSAAVTTDLDAIDAALLAALVGGSCSYPLDQSRSRWDTTDAALFDRVLGLGELELDCRVES